MIKLIPTIIIEAPTENIKVELNYRRLISLSFNEKKRADFDLPSWGIISNSGNLSFNDPYGEIIDYANKGLLRKRAKIQIDLYNSLGVTKKSRKLGEFYSNTWNYDNNNHSVNLSFADDLISWQDIYSGGYPLQETKEMSAYELYKLLEAEANEYDYYFAITEQAEARIKERNIGAPFIEAGTLWQQWDRFSNALALQIYKKNEKVIVDTGI